MRKYQQPSTTQRNSTTQRPEVQEATKQSITCMKCRKPISPQIGSHQPCQSLFCMSHWTQFMQSAQTNTQLLFQCPKCGIKLSLLDRKEIKEVDKSAIHSKPQTCNAHCGQLINMSQFEEHKLNCEICIKYSKKSDEVQKVQIQDESNPETYQCPFCQNLPMRRHLLLDHMKSHANQSSFCPVCAAPSGGSQQYFSKNLYGHLMLRHKTDVPLIPLTILKEQQALKESGVELVPGVNQARQASPQHTDKNIFNKPRAKDQDAQDIKDNKDLAKEEKDKDKKNNDRSQSKTQKIRHSFGLKSNISEKHLLASKPIQILLDSSDDEDEQAIEKYAAQGLIAIFTFGLKQNEGSLSLIEQYWAASHYESAGDLVAPFQRDDEMASCLQENKAPEYLMNIQGICYPEGLPAPSSIKLGRNTADHADSFEVLNSFQKLVYYSTKKFSGQQNYLTILTCARPVLIDPVLVQEADQYQEFKLTPFAFVLVSNQPQFQSGLGSQLLNLMYNTSILGYYQNIANSQAMVLQLEFHLSLLFECANLLADSEIVRLVQMQDSGHQIDLIQVVNSTLGQSANPFLVPNWSFQTLMALITPEHLNMLFSCMLLEKKLILVASDSSFQVQLGIVIESLLFLFEPLDAHVFTNITYALSSEMVMYMDKPGSLIMGISDSMWRQHGQPYWEKYSVDTFIVVFDICRQTFLTKNEEGEIVTPDSLGIPSPFGPLFTQTLSKIGNRNDWKEQEYSMTIGNLIADFDASMAVKQTFFNMIALLFYTIQQLDGTKSAEFDEANQAILAFATELKNTTAFVDLKRRMEDATFTNCEYFQECIKKLSMEGTMHQNYIGLLNHQAKLTKPVIQQLKGAEKLAMVGKLPSQHLIEDLVSQYLAAQAGLTESRQKVDYFDINHKAIVSGFRTRLRQSRLKALKSKKKQKQQMKPQFVKSHSQISVKAQDSQKQSVKTKKGNNNNFNKQSSLSNLNQGVPPLSKSKKAAATPVIESGQVTQAVSPAKLKIEMKPLAIPLSMSEIVPEDKNPYQESTTNAESKPKTSGGFISFFTNLFLAKTDESITKTDSTTKNTELQDDETHDMKQVVTRRHCKSQRVDNEQAGNFLQLLANPISFYKPDRVEEVQIFLQEIAGLQSLLDNGDKEHAENVPQQEEVFNRSKTQSMQITFNSRLQQQKLINLKSAKSLSQEKKRAAERQAWNEQNLKIQLNNRREITTLKKPQTTLNRAIQGKGKVINFDEKAQKPTKATLNQEIKNTSQLRAASPTVTALSDVQKQGHSMQFCDNPKDCKQCQLLALVGRVSLNSPTKNHLTVVMEQSSEIYNHSYASVQPKTNPKIILNLPALQVADGSDEEFTPPNKLGPQTNTSIAQTVQIHKYNSKEAGHITPIPWHDGRQTTKFSQAQDPELRMLELQQNGGPPLLRSDSPEIPINAANRRVESNYIEPGSATELLRHQYRSLFVKQFKDQENSGLPMSISNSMQIAPGYFTNLKPSDPADNQQSEGTPERPLNCNLASKDATRNKSPNSLQPIARPKQQTPSFISGAVTTSQTSSGQATRQPKVQNVKPISKQQTTLLAPPDSHIRKPMPKGHVKKAHIFLEGERNTLSNTLGNGTNSETNPTSFMQMNNTSSFFSQNSETRNSFFIAKQAAAGSHGNVHDASKSLPGNTHNSPEGSLFSSQNTAGLTGGMKQLQLNQQDVKQSCDVLEQRTPTNTASQGKITIHKTLNKNQSLIKLQGTTVLGQLKQDNQLSKSNKLTQRQVTYGASQLASPFAGKEGDKDKISSASSINIQRKFNVQKGSGQLQLNDLIGKNDTQKQDGSHNEHNNEEGWFPKMMENQLVVELLESPDNKSGDESLSNHTSEDMQESQQNEESKGKQNNVLVSQEMHISKAVKEKQVNLFNRPKAVSYKSEQKGISVQQTLRNSIPKQIQQPSNDRSRGINQTVLKSANNQNSQEFNSVNQSEGALMKMRSKLSSQSETIHSIIKRSQLKTNQDSSSGPPKQRQ